MAKHGAMLCGLWHLCSRKKRVDAKEMILSDLGRAGFILSTAKCMLDLVQRGVWLGFILDLYSGTFLVPCQKVSRLQSSIASVKLNRPVQVCALSSIVGQVISMSLAIGPIARMRTRACYAIINQQKTWSDSLMLTEEAKAELHFWKECLPLFNGQPIWFQSSATRVAYSDASSSGSQAMVDMLLRLVQVFLTGAGPLNFAVLQFFASGTYSEIVY